MKAMITVLLAATCFLAAGCASRSKTKLTHVWRDEAFTSAPAKKVLVIGLAATTANRRLYEEAMSARLAARGVAAVAGATVIPAGVKIDRPTVASAIADKGIDLVLLTRLVAVASKSKLIPGGPAYTFTPLIEDDWAGFYVYAVQEYESADTVELHLIADVETRVYETTKGKLVWSAVSQSVNPQSERDVVDQVCGAVVAKLASSRLIP